MKITKTALHTIIIADEGYTFRNKLTNDCLASVLYLGCNDNAENYDEISIEETEELSNENNEAAQENTDTSDFLPVNT